MDIRTRSKRIVLIIDDEKGLDAILQECFNKRGYETVVAYDGKAGLELARSFEPDIIILDINMPKMGGYAVAQILKNDEKLKVIPIVVLTVRDQLEDKEIAKEIGVAEFFTKPFKADDLANEVDRLLKSNN
ncbi:MAG: response regulator [Candidatus Margulisbacteria bacterium]|nr:response regulator [Candidatus Margulisiibacteriota bacterium]